MIPYLALMFPATSDFDNCIYILLFTKKRAAAASKKTKDADKKADTHISIQDMRPDPLDDTKIGLLLFAFYCFFIIWSHMQE